MDIYDEAVQSYNRMALDERVRLWRWSAEARYSILTETVRLRLDGFLREFSERSARGEGGEHYVYVWKHANSLPFYVGSGCGDRYRTKENRPKEFYEHLDKADAVVYILCHGVDAQTARFYEKYASGAITLGGVELANHDNNVFYTADAEKMKEFVRLAEKKPFTEKVKRVIMDCCFVNDDKITVDDMYAKEAHLRECGEHYFSTLFGKIE